MVAQSAVVSISISLGLSISGPLAEMPVGTIGVGGSIAVRPDAIVEDGGSGVRPVSVVSVVGVAQTVVAQSAVVSISISLGLSISRPLAEMPVGTIGVGGSIAVRPDTVVGGGSIGPESVVSVVGVSQTVVAQGAVVGIGISISLGLSVDSSHKSS